MEFDLEHARDLRAEGEVGRMARGNCPQDVVAVDVDLFGVLVVVVSGGTVLVVVVVVVSGGTVLVSRVVVVVMVDVVVAVVSDVVVPIALSDPPQAAASRSRTRTRAAALRLRQTGVTGFFKSGASCPGCPLGPHANDLRLDWGT